MQSARDLQQKPAAERSCEVIKTAPILHINYTLQRAFVPVGPLKSSLKSVCSGEKKQNNKLNSSVTWGKNPRLQSDIFVVRCNNS